MLFDELNGGLECDKVGWIVSPFSPRMVFLIAGMLRLFPFFMEIASHNQQTANLSFRFTSLVFPPLHLKPRRSSAPDS